MGKIATYFRCSILSNAYIISRYPFHATVFMKKNLWKHLNKQTQYILMICHFILFIKSSNAELLSTTSLMVNLKDDVFINTLYDPLALCWT